MRRGLTKGRCPGCGSCMRKETRAPSEGNGCLIVLLGICLIPGVIGFFIVLYGLNLMTKRDGYWRCPECGAYYPRRIPWYEFS
ncbi:MAG: hypothetical protein GY851_32520 [bacterium]|nr:hypothetical protein [bacterium]